MATLRAALDNLMFYVRVFLSALMYFILFDDDEDYS